MQLRRYAEVGDFLEAAGPFLVAREAEHNLILGVTTNLRDAPEDFAGSAYLATVAVDGRIVGAAMQTPPFNIVLSEIDDPAAIECLADDLVGRDLPAPWGRSRPCGRSWTPASPVAARPPGSTSRSGSSG